MKTTAQAIAAARKPVWFYGPDKLPNKETWMSDHVVETEINGGQ